MIKLLILTICEEVVQLIGERVFNEVVYPNLTILVSYYET